MSKHILALLSSMALVVTSPAKGQGVTLNVRSPFDAFHNSEFADEALGPKIPEPYRQHAKGVFYELSLWPNGATVRVCFLDGSSRARTWVAQVASEWTHYGNLKIDVGDVGNPRTCRTAADGDIKITFRADAAPQIGGGYWSYVGVESTNHRPSMMLERLDAEPRPYNEYESRGLVLHEFGHALGLEHEHQSPEAHCDSEIDWPEAYRYYSGCCKWDEQKVRDNLTTLMTEPRLRATAYDRLSIMHYDLPSKIFTNGTANKCFTPRNYVISDADKLAFKEAYSTNEARAQRAARLLRQLDEILKDANVPDLERTRIVGGARSRYVRD